MRKLRPINICHRCPHSRTCHGSVCTCDIDGQDIIAHAEGGRCPDGRFTGADGMASDREPTQAERDRLEMAAAVDRARAGQSEGIGDDLAAILDRVGVAAAVKYYEWVMGTECGCNERRKWMNKWWPHRPAKSTGSGPC